jgi:hypothetical protein
LLIQRTVAIERKPVTEQWTMEALRKWEGKQPKSLGSSRSEKQGGIDGIVRGLAILGFEEKDIGILKLLSQEKSLTLLNLRMGGGEEGEEGEEGG